MHASVGCVHVRASFAGSGGEVRVQGLGLGFRVWGLRFMAFLLGEGVWEVLGCRPRCSCLFGPRGFIPLAAGCL